MPWNCLCAAKEKRKLEISAPILNTEDSSNFQQLQQQQQQQLVPLKQKIFVVPSGSYKFDEQQQQQQQQKKLVVNRHSNVKNPHLLKNGNEKKAYYDSLDRKTLRWKRSKKRNNGSDEGKPTTKGLSLKNVKISEKEDGKIVAKQLANVKFSFEPNGNNSGGSGGSKVDEVDGYQKNGNNYEGDDEDIPRCICNNNNNPENHNSHRNAIALAPEAEINENVNKVDTESHVENENAGNYDEIPLFISSEERVAAAIAKGIPPNTIAAANLNGHLLVSNSSTAATKTSNESIPFIDDELVSNNNNKSPRKHEEKENDHNARFITLEPCNIGCPSINSEQFRNEQAEKYFQQVNEKNFHRKNDFQLSERICGVEENFPPSSASASAGPSPPPPPPVEHSFELWKAPKGKICQVCHESLLLKLNSAVKCHCCDLMCHSWCASSMPSIRYHDTSFIIYRKWLKAQEELAFPTVHRFISKQRNSKTDSKIFDHHLTDSECNYSNSTTTRNGKQNNDEQHRKYRRRTRSLEKRKPPEDLVAIVTRDKTQENHHHHHRQQDDQNNNALSHETIKLHIDESNTSSIRSNDSSTNSQQLLVDMAVDNKPSSSLLSSSSNHDVVVDVHRTNSEALVIKENEFTTKDDVPDDDNIRMRRRKDENSITTTDWSSRASDSSDRTITSEVSNRPAAAPTATATNSHRKRYSREACISLISTSSTDDPSDDTIDYAIVDLRRTAKISPVVDQRRYLPKSNDEDIRENTFHRSQSFPVKSKHHQQISDTLRLHYVTQRVLASVLPRRDPKDPVINRPHIEGHIGLQDKYEQEVISMLEQKHGKNYRVFDLESCISVVTLERICELCKHIDKWLNSGQEKVVVLQDREDRQRLGVAIAAYLEYLDICASSFTARHGASNEDLRAQNTIARNWLALDMFSMKKFLEDFIGPLRIPSHKRYLKYFSGLLSGKIKMNSSPLQLRYVSVESPPSWLQYNRLSSQTEWSSFIKIYEGLHCIYTSDIHIIPITTRQFLFQIGNLRLRGDILIRCYQVCPPESNYSRETRQLLFSVQFHTCAITSNDVAFTKNDLDYAFEDPRFPEDHKVTLNFSKGAITENGYVFQSPLIRTEPPNELAKADSVESFDLSSSYHTQGPLDGSLYATILKSPKSPHFPHQILNTSTPSQQRNSFTQNLISPPPQFSNNKHYELVERRPVSCTPTSVQNNTVETRRREINTSSTLRSHSQPRSDYSYVVESSRPGTSQSHYREKYSTSTPNHYPQGIHQHHQQHQQQQQQQQITIVENYRSGESATNNSNYQNGGREYVRSPLTLSMDSGISSSGALNRPQPGSSVSPSSFPSQASPQEDRHRELDDILSDMLMNVQDIPDFSKSYKQGTHQKIVRSQSVIPTTSSSGGGYVLPTASSAAAAASSSSSRTTTTNYSGDTVKRSQSYNAHENNLVPANNSYLVKDRGDLYDTSSTATTLTPPPSESGRDTPTTVGGYRSGATSNNSTLQHRQTVHREKRETILTSNNIHQHNIHQQQQQQQRGIVMDSQHQSTGYPHSVRTDTVTISAVSEDEDIPYHAREHSQPFTYGNVPPNGQLELESTSTDPRMIKMQSGLSSPSLVRKTLGSSQTLRKTSPRNDFEEMLRERREKVMSEKYSISDRPSNLDINKSYDRSNSSDNKWSSGSANQSNGYHYYNEPLKRSNTLDGFHRSNSTDGLTGQTWLQLQQQKLRAKKDQQLRDDRRYFEEVIHTEIRNRPLRSRANVQRYDGYASDTAAFTDEVDYRRPLHVQTPYNASRSPERNYHTMTTTTTVTKERPFVAVKRAHEQGRRDAVASPPLSPLSVLNASPNGHIAQAQNSNGLLSMADSPRNGQIRLESDNMNIFQDDNNSIACTNSNNYNNINNNHSNDHSSNNHNNINAYNGTDHDSHHQNINLIHHHHQTEQNVHSLNNHDDADTNLASIAACGQLALDRLLASLAAEKDLMDQQLAQTTTTRNGNTNQTIQIQTMKDSIILNESKTPAILNDSPQNRRYDVRDDNFNRFNGDLVNTAKTMNSKSDQELMDVIADLVDYTTYEGLRQMNLNNGCSDSLSNNSNSNSSSNGLPRRLNSDQENSSISPSLSDRSNLVIWHDQTREESFSSYRSETDPELSIAGSPRPETPAFPVTPRTPYSLSSNGNVSPALPPKSPTSQRKDLYTGTQRGHLHEVINQNDTISCYTSRRNSNTSNANSEPQEVAPQHVKFVRDSSKYWYKPNISREEAIALLRNATPGQFIVRDSTTFKNAFGLVLRVAHPPPGVTTRGPGSDELVRHFLVEPTSRGVRLKGCANEPVFTSLSALVYQHSITPLALPCRLIIPDRDIQNLEVHSQAQKQLLTQGAACNVLYLFACDTESLTGEEAVRKAVSQLYASKPLPKPAEVHFKVSQLGITLTDNARQKFFRKHYSSNIISFCGLDPDKRLWSIRAPEGEIPVNNKTIFAFVARRSASSGDNQCHVFCDLQSEQPASAIVSFANKMLPTEKIVNQHI